jgi:drug/metabolite transporter (DMT)-like permease
MTLRAVAIAICVGVLFGGNQVASKIALQQFSPLFCAALAFTLSTMALGIYLGLYKKEQILFSPHIWRLHIISASLFFSFNLIALIGLNLTLASRASIFIAIHPFFVVL